MSFVHLHTHTEYSLLDGAARVKDLVARAVELEMPALAITDHGYMYGAVDFYRQARKAEIKPLIGCEVYFNPGDRASRDAKPSLYHLLLLAKDDTGYRNLMALASNAAVEGYYYKPQVDLALLERHAEGLIATSACMSGIVSKSIEHGDTEAAREWARTYAGIFAPGDFYLEIQEQGITADNGVTQSQLNDEIAAIGRELGLGLVATNDIHYLTKEHAKTQDMLLCIGTGATLDQENRMKFSCDEFYMKTPEQMSQIHSKYPDAIANTLEVAEKCNVDIEFGRIILPKFDVPSQHTVDTYLREQCMEGLKVRYGDPVPAEVVERLDYELSIVVPKGIAAYFLIVADFTHWAREQGIGVGPGRGSAAGSIIAYSLGITNLDPIEQGLLFERFLNPERTEMPDIDMDFDDERRPEVIEYVRQKYGEDKVAQIITFGTMKARAAVRDAGRVLGYPYGVPDKISKLIPAQPLDVTIPAALFGDPKKGIKPAPDLVKDYNENQDTKRILDAAMALEGITRGEGVHAAGVVICPDPLYVHVPVKYDTKGGAVVTQYDGPTVADMGLLKMDFLGLRNLTVIADAVAAIERNHGVKINIDEIPFDDEKTFALYQAADTDAVFQVESGGMKGVLRGLKPTVFGDIVAVVALFRPGPMDSIPEFTARKHGKRPISYYDDRLKPILEETYGLLVYQEQAMRIAMTMAGFSGAKADKLRKGMGKKLQAVMDELKPQFIEGSVANGYEPKLVQQVWDDIQKFGEYAFNKSHAAAYAMVSYQTAYLKAHYPLEYMAAVATSHTGKTDKIVQTIGNCRTAGIAVLPPDVNSSGRDFTAVDGGIRFGLAGIRGVGEGVVDEIVRARNEGGPFTSLQDFCSRVEMRQMNKKTLEALIKAGAFDSTGYTRKHLMTMMDDVVDAAVKRERDEATGQTSMFDLFAAEDASAFGMDVPEPNGEEWDKKVKLAFEKEMLGVYVSDHPLREMEAFITQNAEFGLAEFEDIEPGTNAWFAGMLASVERRVTKAGKMWAIAVLEDLGGSAECLFFPQAYDKFRDLLEVDAVVRVKAKLEEDDKGRKLIAMELRPYDGSGFNEPPKRLVIETDEGAMRNGRAGRLREVLARHPGRDIVEMKLLREDGSTVVVALEQTVDRGASGLHAELMEIFGGHAVRDA